MATKVIMPALGMAQETGVILAWFKQEGDAVEAGEPLLEVETDKTSVELEASASGVLRGVSADAGDEVPVATTIGWIVAPDEDVPEAAAPLSAEKPAPATAAATPSFPISPLARRVAAAHQVVVDDIVPRDGRRVGKEDVLAAVAAQTAPAATTRLTPASPLARRLAQEAGLDVTALAGSGPAGAVLADDVRAAAAGPAATDERTAGVAAEPIPMSRAWAVSAARLAEAWRTIPHFTLQRDVDVTAMIEWRAQAQTRADVKITYTDLLTRCVAAALRQHPRLNASWLNDQIVANAAVNVGLAVAVEDGLVVPVIPATDTLSIAEIAAARHGIVERALAGRLKLPDLTGGTFTISNLGMYGVDRFTAIVNPPQAAILAVGAIADRVVPVKGKPKVRPIMTLTLSLDHRVVDGARGAQFLDTVTGYLTAPLSLL